MAQIIPTEEYVQKKFVQYNNKYFGGKLMMPRIVIKPLYNEWGLYTAEKGTTFNRQRIVDKITGPGELAINSNYQRDSLDLDSTIIHEMIHMYIWTCKRIYPRMQHGKEFIELAQRINSDGFDIRTTNFLKKTDIKIDGNNSNAANNSNASNNSTENLIIGFMYSPQETDYKVWVFRVDPSNAKQYYNLAKSINGVTQIVFYYCNSESFASTFPCDPKYLSGIGFMSDREAFAYLRRKFGINQNNIKKANI